MERQREQLRQRIGVAGWRIVDIDSGEWWTREMWAIENDASTAFVTLLVDPADMEKVWAILATKEKPLDYAGDPPRFVLPLERFETEIEEFVGFIAKALTHDAAF